MSSWVYLSRRLIQLPLVLFVASLTIFSLLHITPGDPVQIMLGMETSPDAVAALRAQFHLDQPLPMQYLIWVGDAIRGDLGNSIRLSQPVLHIIEQRFPISLGLAAAAMGLTLVVAIPAGIFSALRRNTFVDYLITGLSIGGIAIPNFVLALVLIYVFSVTLGWFPITGIGSRARVGDTLWQIYSPFILPSVALAAAEIGLLTRFMRSSMIDVLSRDYIRTARAKGLPGWWIIVVHGMKNAMIPVVTISAIQFGYLIGIQITIEFIFAIPGMGSALLEAVVNRDFPVVQGLTLMTAVFFVLANIVADTLYVLLDPRIRY
ncbi:MAG: ABC transporter permease [Hyphomicrobiales bacterium]|nr:ABC transporter permease [Hyphomicrobiales bacterium]